MSIKIEQAIHKISGSRYTKRPAMASVPLITGMAMLFGQNDNQTNNQSFKTDFVEYLKRSSTFSL